MHPLVKKVRDIAQNLDQTRTETAKHIGTHFSVYDNWLKGKQPQNRSLKKIEKFIERAEAGDTFKPTPKQRPKYIRKIEREKSKLMYNCIYYLERKYGELKNADESDPILKLFREQSNQT